MAATQSISSTHKKPIEPVTHDAEDGIVHAIKLDPFGNPLHPTPTSDPMDPLNWSKFQKYICITIVCFYYFLFTYHTTAPIPSFSLLQEQFDATYTQVNWTFAIPSLGLALGPLFCSSLADIYGRRVVIIGGTMIALIASGCTSLHGISISQYMAARFFQGFGCSPAATVGLSVINDISWEHERGFRIGLWVMAIDLGGLCGGFIGGFIATVDQYWIAYHVTILFSFLLVLECCFLPETLYPRAKVVEAEAALISNNEKSTDAPSIDIKRTKELGYVRFGKVPGVYHPKPWHALLRTGKIFAYPTVAISVVMYVFCQYWWICSLLTMEPAAYFDYSLQVQGLFFSGLILGTVTSEILFSGRLSDWIVGRFAHRNGGVRTPEMRLWLGYPACVLSALGLILWGLSIDGGWHWITGQIAFFLYGAGLQIGNTALSAYIVDSYVEHSMEIITFYSVILNLSAFIEPWYINLWVEATGYTWSFAAQGIICIVGVIPTYIILQKFGARWRKPMHLGDD